LDIMSEIEKINSEEIKKVFSELMKEYLNPSFSSMSKREFDILLFMKLQKLGIFKKNPELYEIISSLKVTRAKARNLLYESKLRELSTIDLDEELKELLKKPKFLKENDKLMLEIGNPLLIDHLKSKLKEIGHLTDGSFSPELVKLTSDAYLSLFEEMRVKGEDENIKEFLIKEGVIEDSSVGGMVKDALGHFAKKVIGDAGGTLIDKYLGPMIDGRIDKIKEYVSHFLKEEK